MYIVNFIVVIESIWKKEKNLVVNLLNSIIKSKVATC